MLHEFAHAFHHLELGFEHEGIVDVYKKAMDSGKYDKVLHIGGRETRHYAATNHKEYFAEMTEAFFGGNDYYPFVRAELKDYDPEAYKIVRETWGVKR